MRLIDADALIGSLHGYGFCDGIDRTMVYRIIQLQPTIELEPKTIEYQDCANALLKMWMDNVLTDGEYSKIISKLNAHLIEMAYKEGDQE